MCILPAPLRWCGLLITQQSHKMKTKEEWKVIIEDFVTNLLIALGAATAGYLCALAIF